MSKYIKSLATAAILASSLASAQSDPRQAMLELVRQNMQESCNDQPFLDCSNIDKQTCIDVAATAFDQCASLFPEDLSTLSNDQLIRFESDFETCTNGAAKYHGIDIELTNHCSQQLKNWN